MLKKSKIIFFAIEHHGIKFQYSILLLRLLVFSMICLLSTLLESHSHYSADKKKKKLLLLNLALNWNGRNNKHLQRWSFLPDFSSVRNHSKSWENLSSSTLKQPWSYSPICCMHASALFYFRMFNLLKEGKLLPSLKKHNSLKFGLDHEFKKLFAIWITLKNNQACVYFFSALPQLLRKESFFKLWQFFSRTFVDDKLKPPTVVWWLRLLKNTSSKKLCTMILDSWKIQIKP